MAVIKVACPKCGQKVSGDHTFYGKKVNCPICTARIEFPDFPGQQPAPGTPPPPENLQPTYEMPVQQQHQPQPVPPAATGPSFDESGIHGTGAAAAMQPAMQPAPHQSSYSDGEGETPSAMLGIISFILGLVNTLTGCIFLGIFLAPPAIILGHLALGKASKSSVRPYPGNTLAVIGTILGYTGMVCTILALICVVMFKEPLLQQFEEAQNS